MCVQVEIQGLLGRGACGTVYQAIWRGLPIALKTLVFEMVDSATKEESAAGAPCTHEQALLETAVAASVNHANVVSKRQHHTYIHLSLS